MKRRYSALWVFTSAVILFSLMVTACAPPGLQACVMPDVFPAAQKSIDAR